jgi:hypothetical protein
LFHYNSFYSTFLEKTEKKIRTVSAAVFSLLAVDGGSDKCTFPEWMGRHHDWISLDGHTSLHLNKRGHSLRIANDSGVGMQLESHATCHNVEVDHRDVSRIVAHVKAGW